MGDGAVEDEEAVENEDAGHWWLRAAIAAMTTSSPAARIRRIRIRRVAGCL